MGLRERIPPQKSDPSVLDLLPRKSLPQIKRCQEASPYSWIHNAALDVLPCLAFSSSARLYSFRVVVATTKRRGVVGSRFSLRSREPHLFPVTSCLCNSYFSSYSISPGNAAPGRLPSGLEGGEWDYGNESHRRRVTLPYWIYCLTNPCPRLNDVRKQVPTAGFTMQHWISCLDLLFSSSARLYSFRVVVTTKEEELLVLGDSLTGE
ncbi:hypothetical protein CEXT_95061 [Caerostris extrusa]|uniref:Uncharacterized protein n=1 Tax=Caerostris extrusa TaxID=172846 RepID=A0AAV4PEM7_CAEEX|nr:hypothetical protein CEXT_95061 [Caerostris extrusa]